MKKFKKFYTLAALLVAGAAFEACTEDNEIIASSDMQKVYTMTVDAVSGANTRSLTESDGALTAAWNADDEVVVYKVDGDSVGTLKPVEAGATKLKGTVSDVEVGDKLTLTFLPDASYAEQEGTLEYIDTNCNAAVANVEVTKIEGTDVYTSDAAFENQQSIFKFTLKDASGKAISATKLTISFGNETITTITVTPAESASVLYVAMPGVATSTDFTFEATTETGTFNGVKGKAIIEEGLFYVGNIVLKKIVDLSKITADYVAQDGDVLTGKATDKYKISVADGATVTLQDVDISSFDYEGPKYAGINCIGDATLVIEGVNYVKGAYHECSGIHVPTDKTLTIEGTGKLTAESNGYGAGIGAGFYWGSAGNIVINSGEIIANGGKDAAGIGCGCERSCGYILINGGTVTANGGIDCAGIGSGYYSRCDSIEIKGGTVIANGGEGAAGIGAGRERGSCGLIKIEGGDVTATGGKNGAGIGSGYYSSSCDSIRIVGGTVKAIGGIDAAGIGTGPTWYHNYQSRCGGIDILGGTIEATKAGVADYDVGPGNGARYGYGVCGTVTIGEGITIKDKNGNSAVIYTTSSGGE